MGESPILDPVAFRKSRSWSQRRFAEELGVTSKGYISDLERGRERWPLRLAMKLERISAGVVPAASICPEAAELGA